MDETKAEIYRYIRDQHDKHIAARESLISRFGNIRILAALLLTVFSFSIGVVVKSIENAHSLWPRIVAITPLIFFSAALYYVVRALMTIPNLVGTIYIHTPVADEKIIMEALKFKGLKADQVIEDLSSNYLSAIRKNMRVNKRAGKRLRSCASFLRKGICSTIFFLFLTLLSNIVVLWLFSGR